MPYIFIYFPFWWKIFWKLKRNIFSQNCCLRIDWFLSIIFIFKKFDVILIPELILLGFLLSLLSIELVRFVLRILVSKLWILINLCLIIIPTLLFFIFGFGLLGRPLRWHQNPLPVLSVTNVDWWDITYSLPGKLCYVVTLRL